MPRTIAGTFGASGTDASVGLRRAELALIGMMVAIFVLTISVSAKLALEMMGYGPQVPTEIILEGSASEDADDG